MRLNDGESDTRELVYLLSALSYFLKTHKSLETLCLSGLERIKSKIESSLELGESIVLMQCIRNLDHKVDKELQKLIEKGALSHMREWLPSDLLTVLYYYSSKARINGSQIPEELEVFLRTYLGEFKNRLNAVQFAEIVEHIGIIQRLGRASFNIRLYDALNATLYRDYYRFSARELRSLVSGFSAIKLEASKERGLQKLKKLILESKRDIDDQGKLELLQCLLEHDLDPILDP